MTTRTLLSLLRAGNITETSSTSEKDINSGIATETLTSTLADLQALQVSLWFGSKGTACAREAKEQPSDVHGGEQSAKANVRKSDLSEGVLETNNIEHGRDTY